MAAERNADRRRARMRRNLYAIDAMTGVAFERNERFAPAAHVADRKANEEARVRRAPCERRGSNANA